MKHLFIPISALASLLAMSPLAASEATDRYVAAVENAQQPDRGGKVKRHWTV